MPSNRFKKTIRKIHLWLGLASGLVVFIVSITGAIYVFQEEINLFLQTGVYKNVAKEDRPFLSPLTIKKKAEAYFQKEIISMNATVYPAGDRATIVWVRDTNRKYTAIVQNPYTGAVINSYPYNVNFWAVILGLHTSLLIPEIGHHIVSISTVIFIIMMISGIVLWYPKSKKGFKQRFSIKWNATPKRLNYDLHNVLGFYISLLAILIAFTGLFMSYDWLKNSVYQITTGQQKQSANEIINSHSSHKNLSNMHHVDDAFLTLIHSSKKLNNYFIDYAIDSTDTHTLVLNSEKGFFYNRHDSYILDQYTGAVLKKDLWKNKNNGERYEDANLNIHIGAILGLPGKILAFIASLIAASLPITGLYIWLGRKKKKKQPALSVKISSPAKQLLEEC